MKEIDPVGGGGHAPAVPPGSANEYINITNDFGRASPQIVFLVQQLIESGY